MKVNESYVDPENGEKVLDILKTSLEPGNDPLLTLTKYRTSDKAAYKIGYTAYVSKEEYKRIKAIANGETFVDDETNSPKLYVLPENVQEYLEHLRAILLDLANHEDCEK